jgi:hypothetical protein
MLFKEMVYEIIKVLLGSTETDFTYQSYIAGNFKDDYRYKEAENAIFLPINLAISRLHDLRKVEHFVNKLICIDSVVLLPKETKEVFAVQDFNQTQYEFAKIGNDELLVKEGRGTFRTLVEITKNKKFGLEDLEVDLAEYGLTNEMCFYIIEFALGRVLLETSPSEATIHVNTAESYFSNIPTASLILKPCVSVVHKI